MFHEEIKRKHATDTSDSFKQVPKKPASLSHKQNSVFQFAAIQKELRSFGRCITFSTGKDAPLQFAGNFTNLMPIHEANHPDSYTMLTDANTSKELRDYTYHHIIPENKWQQVYKEIANILSNRQYKSKIQKRKDSFLRAGRRWSRMVHLRDTAYLLNQHIKNFYDVELNYNDIKSVYTYSSNPDGGIYKLNLNKLTSILKNATKQTIHMEYLKLEAALSNEPNFNKRVSLATAFIEKIKAKFRSNKKIILKSFEENINAKAIVHTITTSLGIDISNTTLSLVQDIKKQPRLYTVPVNFTNEYPDEYDNELNARMCWIVGNIHQGPSSTLRLAPKDDGYNVQKDDGGDKFESSAKNILFDNHFKLIETLSQYVEELLAKETPDIQTKKQTQNQTEKQTEDQTKKQTEDQTEINRKIEIINKMFPIMTTLMNPKYFTVFAGETAKKWYNEPKPPDSKWTAKEKSGYLFSSRMRIRIQSTK